jgi:hypothetical protein
MPNSRHRLPQLRQRLQREVRPLRPGRCLPFTDDDPRHHKRSYRAERGLGTVAEREVARVADLQPQKGTDRPGRQRTGR